MWRAILFYWECTKDAARGTLEFANAWAYLIGVGIVAVAGYGLWGLELVPPGDMQGYFTLALLALIATWMVTFAIRFIGAPSRLFWREHDARLAAETQLSSIQVPDADWPIRDLFYHIRPDLTDDPDSMLWKQVGADIRDAFSLGRLKVWGRIKSSDVADVLLGERSPLSEIDSDYWQHADFTYWFIATDDDYSGRDHTYPNGGWPIYRDLRVNRAAALAIIWP
jgi:hypothetical protein